MPVAESGFKKEAQNNELGSNSNEYIYLLFLYTLIWKAIQSLQRTRMHITDGKDALFTDMHVNIYLKWLTKERKGCPNLRNYELGRNENFVRSDN